MKRLPPLLLGVFLLVVILSGSAFSAETEAPLLDPLGIQDWGIHFVDDREILFPTQLFRDMAEWSGAEETDWFRSFDLDGEFVSLSPFEFFTLSFYSEDPDYLAHLRSEYENKNVVISYSDGVTSVASSSGSFNVAEPAPHGAGGSSFESLTIDRWNFPSRVGIKVTVTVEVYANWTGGSNVYFEILGVRNTPEKSDNSYIIHLDSVTDMKVNQSAGSHTRAYADVWIKTKGQLFTFSEWPAPFSFLWEDGYFTGSTVP